MDLLKQATECILDAEKLHIYHGHSQPQAPQHRDLREDSGIQCLCALNMATLQETFQILSLQASWKNPGQSSTMSLYKLLTFALHLEGFNFQILKIL